MVWDRWHCYEFLKQHYDATGRTATLQEISSALPGLSQEEQYEGFAEFVLVINKRESEVLYDDADPSA